MEVTTECFVYLFSNQIYDCSKYFIKKMIVCFHNFVCFDRKRKKLISKLLLGQLYVRIC